MQLSIMISGKFPNQEKFTVKPIALSGRSLSRQKPGLRSTLVEQKSTCSKNFARYCNPFKVLAKTFFQTKNFLPDATKILQKGYHLDESCIMYLHCMKLVSFWINNREINLQDFG